MSDARTSKDQLSVLLDRFRNRLGEHWGRSHTEAVFNEAIRLKGERDDYAAKYDKWMQRALKTEGSTHEPPAAPARTLIENLHGYVTATSDQMGYAKALQAIELALGRAPSPPTPDDARDASRWRALIGCARVRVLGCAGLNDPASEYAHIGVELWTRHPAQSLPESIETLTAFADRAVLTKAPEHCTACGEPHGGKCPYSSGGEGSDHG